MSLAKNPSGPFAADLTSPHSGFEEKFFNAFAILLFCASADVFLFIQSNADSIPLPTVVWVENLSPIAPNFPSTLSEYSPAHFGLNLSIP